MNWDDISASISAHTGRAFSLDRMRSTGGGCINDTSIISDGNRSFFIKLNGRDQLAMFEAEAEGLHALNQTGTIRVPAPISTGISDAQCFIVMEALELGGRVNPELLGQQLAQLHQHTAEQFGWHRDNTIGSTPQNNTRYKDWVDFFRDQRLVFQLELARDAGIGKSTFQRGMKLAEALDVFFSDYRPVASVLHGDLWSGNVGADQADNPVIFDPAVYYGDHEADLAMTELFGGFGTRFFDAYSEVFPIDPGYSSRRTLYNLYHILNHFNLFGGGYGQQADSMINRLLSEC
jgi:protein-ribulosamine 3-kinase